MSTPTTATGPGPEGREQAPIAAPLTEGEALEAMVTPGSLAGAGSHGPADEPLFRSFARLAARCLGTCFGFVAIGDPGAPEWSAGHGWGEADAATGAAAIVDRRLSGALLTGDTTVAATDLDDEAADVGLRSWMGATMRKGDGTVCGSLSVATTGRRAWQAEDREALAAMAEIAMLLYTTGHQAIEAERNQATLRTIVDNAPIGFALLDDQHRYVMINETLAAINGRPVEDHLGLRLEEVIPALSEPSRMVTEVLRSGRQVLDIEIRGETAAAPGVERCWLTSYYPVDLGAGTRGVCALVRDVTDQVRSRQRAEQMALLAGRLASVRTMREVARIVAEDVAPYVGGDHAALYVVDESGTMLTCPAAEQHSPTEPTWPVGPGTPLGRALEDGEIVVAGADPPLPDESWREAATIRGLATVAAVPLRHRRGEARRAVLEIGWRRPLGPDEIPRPHLRILAELCSQTVARVVVSESQRQLAASLRRALMAAPAPEGGPEVALRYRSATRSLGFGGDWHDVVAIDDARTALIVGDVVGHDPTAAARMTQIRTVVADVLQLTDDLPGLFDAVERLLRRSKQTIWATSCVTVVDHDARRLACLSAGHLPPLLRLPAGSVTTVAHAHRSLIGHPAERLEVQWVPYEPGSILVAYTDGMIESRVRDLDVGLDALRARLAAGDGGSVEHLADALLAQSDVSDLEDDVALLVARLP